MLGVCIIIRMRENVDCSWTSVIFLPALQDQAEDPATLEIQILGAKDLVAAYLGGLLRRTLPFRVAPD